VAKERPPELPLAAIRDMLRWFKSARVPGVIIGGVAVSMQGHPRYTRDLDPLVIVDHAELPKFIAGAEKFGFSGRVPDVLEFARETRMLLLQHKVNSYPLGVSLGALEFEVQLIRRASIIGLGRLKIPVATPEDLIILKAIADRRQDQADIENLLAAHSHIDYHHIRRTLAEFSAILDRPDILEQVEKLLVRHENRGKR
jgi:hypothetical protein